MTAWIEGRRRQWYGFTDMGRIQIAPVPRYIVLTDRADSVSLWWLSINTTEFSADNLGYISIVSGLPPASKAYTGNIETFAAYEEPYFKGIDNGALTRLIVRNGFLGVDVVAPTIPVRAENNLRLIATQLNTGFNQPLRELILSTSPPGFYSWVPVNTVQTANPAPNIE